MTAQPTRDQLRALADAATPGPWEVHGSLVGVGRAEPDFGQTWGVRWRQDIEFICAARTAVPQLLDQLDQAEARIEAWEKQYVHDIDYWIAAAETAEARIKAVRYLCDDADKHPASVLIVTKVRRAVEG